jgi:hypothetical protein
VIAQFTEQLKSRPCRLGTPDALAEGAGAEIRLILSCLVVAAQRERFGLAIIVRVETVGLPAGDDVLDHDLEVPASEPRGRFLEVIGRLYEKDLPAERFMEGRRVCWLDDVRVGHSSTDGTQLGQPVRKIRLRMGDPLGCEQPVELLLVDQLLDRLARGHGNVVVALQLFLVPREAAHGRVPDGDHHHLVVRSPAEVEQGIHESSF